MTGPRSGLWRPGRDARAVRHPGPAGPARAGAGRSALVLGGGIAGLAAATGLAERGVEVTLLERADRLGGRVRSWPVEVAGGAATMSRGFHAFFRQYYNLRALLSRADPGLTRLVPLPDYPLALAGGPTESFARVPRTPPLNFAGFVALSPSFKLGDLLRVDVDAALGLLDVDFPGTYSELDGVSAAEFLDRLRFPATARHLALEVFSRSFFARPEEFAAGELVAMLHGYFLGSAEGLLFEVPRDDFDAALWAPLADYLTGLGVRIRTGTAAVRIAAEPDGIVVDDDAGRQHRADAVVLATDPTATPALLAASSGLNAGWQRQLLALRTAPPFAVWRLWLDRPPARHRPAFLGTSGYGPLDNVSILDRYENGARAWATAAGGAVLELHAYALPEPVDDAGLRLQLRAALSAVYPETASATVLGEQWRIDADCPLIGTTPWRDRPGVRTPDPRIVLAGDQVRCDWPVALMERAATTGWLAANALLDRWGARGHDLWTVPIRGRHRWPGRLRRVLAGFSRGTRRGGEGRTGVRRS